VSALADEIGNDPVFLTLLNPSELQRQQLPPSKAAVARHYLVEAKQVDVGAATGHSTRDA